ncbi:MAG: N-acetylmuramoyl-L-alanine amidase [Bacteroidota bacterium]
MYPIFFFLFTCLPMTASSLNTLSAPTAFNVSLMEKAGKSTPVAVLKETSARNLIRTILLPSSSLQKVVIDAGHGGKDPGGMGKNSQEKHIALKIAQLLAIGIRTNFPEVEVIMTRSDDTFIPLYERAAIANEEGADLFISIHANIMPGSKATYGTETFVMGQHVAKHNLAVAKRENASILLEENVQQNYGYDPNSDEGHIMMSMFQHAFLERSITFAELVEQEFAATGRKSRGVKQAGFVVLKETTMPSVLIETGFMSNQKEEAYLLSGVGQQRLANAILKAFNSYYKLMGGKASATSPTLATAPPQNIPTANYPPVQVRTSSANKVNVLDKEVREVLPLSPKNTPQAPSVAQANWVARGVSPQPIAYQQLPSRPANAERGTSYGTLVPAPLSPLAAASKPEANSSFASLLSREVTNSLQPRPSVYSYSSRNSQPIMVDTIPKPPTVFTDVGKQTPTVDFSKIPDRKLQYAIQIIATKRNLDLTEPRWQKIPYTVRKYQEGGWNKYQIREVSTANDAKTARTRVRAAGFSDAMIVVYYNNQRVGPAATNYLLNREVK